MTKNIEKSIKIENLAIAERTLTSEEMKGVLGGRALWGTRTPPPPPPDPAG